MSWDRDAGALWLFAFFWQVSQVFATSAASLTMVGQKKPCLIALPAKALVLMCDPQNPLWMPFNISMPWCVGTHLK
jgi:hypothetical protein